MAARARLPGALLTLALAGCAGPAPLRFEGSARALDVTPSPGQSVEISGRDNMIRVVGRSRELRVAGQDNNVRVMEAPGTVTLEGQGNTVDCDAPPERLVLRGRGHRVRLQLPAGSTRPQVDVSGPDQAVQFLTPAP